MMYRKLVALTDLTEGINNPLLPLYVSLIILFFIHSQFKARPLVKLPPLPLPPGPRPWPILGNFMQLGKMPHVTLSEFAKVYGPLISLKLGTQLVIVGSSPAVAEEILKEKDHLLSARYVPHVMPVERSKLSYISLGWSPKCGIGWKYLRTICKTELFSRSAIESQTHVREKKVMEMVELISSKEGDVVDIGEVVFATVLNMLSNILVSKDFIEFKNGTVDGEMKNLVRQMMEVSAMPNISDLYPILSGLDLQGIQRKSKELTVKMNDMWTAIIEERRHRKAKEGDEAAQSDFLDVLIENDFTDEIINQLYMELFTAGTDSSSTTVEWAMAELIKNPESMDKVREELTKEISQDKPKESNLSKLKYMEACVKETLRLHPPAPLLLPHRAPRTCSLMNYFIPKNSQVLVNIWAIGRDPTIWKDPLEFNPERFVQSSLDFKGKHFEFLPFGAGRRICPGLPMAAKQVPLVLASLVKFFDWTLPHGAELSKLDMTEKLGITSQKAQPLFLIPKVRK